ncbi:MAG: hypothetical protein ACM3L6_07140 [Deltaproteobacteria bacterium]
MSKISKEVQSCIIKAKKKNRSAAVREIAQEIKKIHGVKLSKSSVATILKENGLSSSVGRRISGESLGRVKSSCAGYYFFTAAEALLGVSRSVAACFRRACPTMHMSERALEDVVSSWLLAKVMYSVDFSKVIGYDKRELWQILGRRASKGGMGRFLETYNSLQHIGNEIVADISNLLREANYLRFDLEDRTSFFVDGTFNTIWSTPEIPIDFSATVCNLDGYVNSILKGREPVVVFNARAEADLNELLADFIFALQDSSPRKKIRSLSLISSQHAEIKNVAINPGNKLDFIIGIWPWQYKMIRELEQRRAMGYVFNEPLELKYPYVEESIRFAQHIDNNEVRLRIIVIKEREDGHARIALFTNMDPQKHTARNVVERFVRRFPFFEEGHRAFLEILREPAYADAFQGEKQLIEKAQAIRDARSADEAFGVLVEIVNAFMQRSFFPAASWGWSILKMRELYFKIPGKIRRDYADDVICNLLPSKELNVIRSAEAAALRLNGTPVFDPEKKKLWMRLSAQ